MKRFLASFVLLIVILSSGCTVPVLNIDIPFLPDLFPGTDISEERHDIIAIESLDIIPAATLRSSQDIRLRAVVKNLQRPEYSPKENVNIRLFNDCGLFEKQLSVCQGEEADDGETCRIGRMYPQSHSIIEWILRAKEVNVETTCKLGVLAEYDHTTYSTGSVTFINKDEVERLVSEGKTFSERGRTTVGEGPVKPYIEVANQPIIIDASMESSDSDAGRGIMTFWVQNRGGGVIELADASEGNVVFEDIGYVKSSEKMYVDIDGGDDLSAFVSSGNGDAEEKKGIEECIKQHMLVSGNDAGEKYSVHFMKGKTPDYLCSVTVNTPNNIKQEKTYQIEAEIRYGYKFIRETMVTIKPKIKI